MKFNYSQLVLAALTMLFTKTATVSVGGSKGVTLSAANSGGAPVHFTPAMLLAAGEQYLAGHVGSITVGSTVITVKSNS